MGTGTGPLVVCVGLCVVDLILSVDRRPDSAGKFFASRADESAGGPAATAAAAIARLGGTARFVGRLGNDARGDLAVSLLEVAGVEVEVERVASVTTPVSAVLVTPDGERTIINHADPRLFGTPPPPEAFAGADVVLADVRWPEGAAAAMTAARTAGALGVLDLDRVPTDDRDRLRPAVEAASHVVASQPGAEAFGAETADRGLDVLAAMTSAWVAVTAGADGVFWPGGRLSPPAVTAVDTLGAGDVFHGAFALALAEGQHEPDALRFASAAAAVACTRSGGWSSFGARDEVEQLMEETWN